MFWAVAGPSRAAANRPLSVTVRSMPNFARPSSTCGPSLIPPGPSTSFKPFTKAFGPLPGRHCRRRLPPGIRPLSGICPTLPGLCPTLQELLQPPRAVYIIQTVHKSARTVAGPPPAAAGRRLTPPAASRAPTSGTTQKLPQKWCLYLLTIYY
jgi:hypothetical protein